MEQHFFISTRANMSTDMNKELYWIHHSNSTTFDLYIQLLVPFI
jgi:hypothetical protein